MPKTLRVWRSSARSCLRPIPAGFGIAVQMTVKAPGMDHAALQALVDKAHQVCPYSNATRGNIEVTFTLA